MTKLYWTVTMDGKVNRGIGTKEQLLSYLKHKTDLYTGDMPFDWIMTAGRIEGYRNKGLYEHMGEGAPWTLSWDEAQGNLDDNV